MNINIDSQIVVQTAAQWAADATVYSAKRILVTSDEYYGSTDQRKFKIANGVDTWSNLDYVPISQTLAEVLVNGNSTGGSNIVSPNGNSIASIFNSYLYLRGGASNKGELYLSTQEADLYNAVGGFFAVEGLLTTDKYFKVTTAKNIINHDVQVDYNSPLNNFPQETASRVAIFDASKNLKAADTTTYPSLTELSYVKGVTSAIQTQINSKQDADADLTSWAGVTRASGFDTFAATPSSANLRLLLTDETGTGAAYFQGGALGTPSSGTLTNCTGLPIAGITGYQGYSLNGGVSAAVNPADSTSYYIGSYRTTLSTVDGAARIIFPKAGTIKTIYTFVRVAGTLGSNEAVPFSFRLNSTTNTSLGNQTWDAVSVVGTYTGLSISVSAGDFGELLIAAPAWATNPTTVTIYFAFYLE